MLHQIIVLMLMAKASQETLEVNKTVRGSEEDVNNTTDESNTAPKITWRTEQTPVNLTNAHYDNSSRADVTLVTDQTSDVSVNSVTSSAKVIMTVSSAILEAIEELKTINSTAKTSYPTTENSTTAPETSKTAYAVNKISVSDRTTPITDRAAPTTEHTITMMPETSKTTPETIKTTPETSKTTPETIKTTPETSKTTPETSKTTPETSKTTTSTSKTTQVFSKGIEATSELVQKESPTDKSFTSENKAKCAFDHCSVTAFSYCLHNGSCITDKSTCKTKCKCQNNFAGDRCQTEVSKQMETGLHMTNQIKVDSSACSKLNCKNGNCVNLSPVTSRCVCNEGWFGSSCATSGHILPDEIIRMLLPSTVEKDFPSPKTRSNEGASISERVAPDIEQMDHSENERSDGHETPRPITKIKNKVISRRPLNLRLVNFEADDKNEQAESKDNNLATADGFPDPRYNVCAEDRMVRSDDERTCDMRKDLPCKYGVCVQEEVDHGSWKGYVTNCTCDLGARGTFCDYKCCLDCGENGKCDIIVEGNNVTELCNCRHRYTGLNCEIYVPDPVSIKFKDSKWFLWIVGACIALFVLLVVAAIVAPYMMWKHRVILVMKIVHYFQAYEDDDEKEWDAFVSYKSHPVDEHFVVHVLYPKLEQELGFKLCLHFRDFVPGETISNNIINAVEGSRRTILILTPRYIESEFTRFEYQKAQTEMLKRKHRIIPIMLEDISGISSNMDKNLKGIINSVTYLEWPGTEEVSKRQDKFWKRLQLSLPKKKVGQQNSNLQYQSSVDSGICSENSTGNDTGVSSAKNKWSEHSFGSMVSNVSSVSYGDGDVYDVIGHINESLSRSVKPFSDFDEFSQLANTSPYDYVSDIDTLHRVQDSKNSQQEIRSGVDVTERHNPNSLSGNYNLSEHYVDMEHDRYIEFSLEDNPPSVSLTRKAFVVNKKMSPGCMTLQTEGYMEIDV